MVRDLVFCGCLFLLICESVYGMREDSCKLNSYMNSEQLYGKYDNKFNIQTANEMELDSCKLDSSIDPKQLYLGKYDDEFTIQTIKRSTEIVDKIALLDRTSVDKLCASLKNISLLRDKLKEEERIAFDIYLMGIAFNIPGECFSPEGDFKTIALANVLVHFVDSTEEFTKRWNEGTL